MGSHRFPGKVMQLLDGQPVLAHVVARCRLTHFPVIVATPDTSTNQPIWDWCKEHRIPYFKGHPTDLTKRYLDCAIAYKADPIIRITADSPFINTELIVLTERFFRQAGSTGFMELEPIHGLNVEIFDRGTLEAAHQQGPDEHCTTWMRKQPWAMGFPSLELNTPDDYKRLQGLYSIGGEQ